ncbi:MAG: FHA domain-containing protein [Planctomycetes bacterium]|nr:FHA domain-containing protein [Planctomycetota bacterium]
MPTLKTIAGVEPFPKPVKLSSDVVFIGRAKVCKIVLMDKLASRKHVKIFKIDELFYVEDLKSCNGTFLNGKELKAPTKLNSGDVIKVGEHEIIFDTTSSKAPSLTKASALTAVKTNPDEVFEPTSDVAFGAPGTVYCVNFVGSGGSFNKVLLKPITTIGRGDEADIHIDESLASRLHCQFEIKAGGLKLVDLESRNGTKVNDEFVNQQYITKDDEILLGSTKIKISSRLPLTTGEYQELKIEEALEKNMDIDQLLPTGDIDKPVYEENADLKVDYVIPILQYQLEDGSDKSFDLHKNEVTIGRSDEATLTISDKLSSRIHAKIFCDDKRYFIEDLNSRNSTKINNREVKGKIELLPGDKILIGEIEFTFVVPDEKAIVSDSAATSVVPAIPDEIAQIARKPKIARDKRYKKSATEPADYTGLIIAGVVLLVVFILAIVLIVSNNKGGGTEFPPEPKDTTDLSTDKTTGTISHHDSNGTSVKDDNNNKKDDNKINDNDVPDDDSQELTERERDQKWIWSAESKFEEKAREDFVNVKNKVVYDLLYGENFGTAYVLTNEKIKDYQNKDLDDIVKRLYEILELIDKEAKKFWEGYLRNAIKQTPEDKRAEKFKDEIIDAFEGYDKYYEPAMQMIGN